MKITVALLSLFTCSILSNAQYTGPVSVEDSTHSVLYIMQNIEMLAHQPKHMVTVEGFLLQKKDHNLYLFSDGTAKMLVHIENESLPNEEFNDSSLVRLYGNLIYRNTDKFPHLEVSSIILMHYSIPQDKKDDEEKTNETTIGTREE